LEVGAEGGFKLDFGRQDHDPGKQKLKGAVRTATSGMCIPEDVNRHFAKAVS
jgi:hypothetical protein